MPVEREHPREEQQEGEAAREAHEWRLWPCLVEDEGTW